MGVVRRLVRFLIVALVTSAVLAVVVIQIGSLSGRWRLVPILSGSMAPEMATGSIAVVVPVAPSAVHVGDVLVFAAPVKNHLVVVHRLVKRLPDPSGPIYSTKGDANTGIDPWRFRIVGPTAWRVERVISDPGLLLLAADRPWVRFSLVAIVVATLATSFLTRIWRKEPTNKSAISDATLTTGS